MLLSSKEKTLSLNPCCNGKCSWRNEPYEKEEKPEVSILVVMENALGGLRYASKRTIRKVSILVVMENALGGQPKALTATAARVSILVVMENALGGTVAHRWANKDFGRLNPCCNGKCSWRRLEEKGRKRVVSILVVMENALGEMLFSTQLKTKRSQSLL